MIKSGLKLRAFNVFLKIKQGLKAKEKTEPSKSFLVSMMMSSPNIYLLPLKLGGRSVGVPVPITEKKKVSLSIRFVMKALKEKSRKLFSDYAVEVLVSSIYGRGPAVERKQLVYKAGSLNRHRCTKFFVG